MPDTFAATALTQTAALPQSAGSREGQRLEIALADASGNTQTLSLTAELSAALSDVLRDFAMKTSSLPGALTKRPDGFAVGAGKYESVVLLRFEDETPYGLVPGDAVSLGRALLAQAKFLHDRPSRRLQ